jgi:adenine-specific DNA-methyltransferase
MEKLKLHTPDLVAENIRMLAEVFPNCVTETRNEHGELALSVDFDQLRQELADHHVEGPRERYHLDWPGKREAILMANSPIAKTLRPCREESVEFDATQNLFLEGENLDALKLLRETYLGRVKMIYIDPPYNTGDEHLYDDDRTQDSDSYLRRSNQQDDVGNRLVLNLESNGRFHSDWLTMIFSRLRLARNLLSDDGVIFISIDDHELRNLQAVCDEVFGASNFIGVFIWEKRKTRENRKVFSVNHDYVIAYARSKPTFEALRGLLPRSAENEGRFDNPDNDRRGPWQSVSMNAQAAPGRRREQFYTVVTPSGRRVDPPSGRCWVFTEDRFEELKADGRIWFGEDGGNVPRIKVFRDESSDGVVPHTLWQAEEVGTTDTAKKAIKELFDGTEVFDTPKPIPLLRRMLQISTGSKEREIVMDFFAGAAPLAEAVLEQNAEDSGRRSVILVQIPEACDPDSEAYKAGYMTIAEVAKERFRRVGAKLKAGAKLTSPSLDVGFRVLKIDTSNMKDVYYTPDQSNQGNLLAQVDNIKGDRTPEDLLFQILVDWGVDLTLPIAQETIAGRTVYFVDSNALAACFDQNIGDDLVKEIAKRKPLRAVFRDSSYGSDSVKINVEQIFKLLSPSTEVRSI